ncbi:MAG: hypothetical protein U1F76_04530 [Candidatus Competibacteraceae bacterium]
MSTIPVIIEPVSELEGGTLGLEEIAGRVTQIDADVLRKSISNLAGQITALFEDIKAVGSYKLTTVQVQLEITTEGGVALIGSLKAGAKGAITLTFSS